MFPYGFVQLHDRTLKKGISNRVRWLEKVQQTIHARKLNFLVIYSDREHTLANNPETYVEVLINYIACVQDHNVRS